MALSPYYPRHAINLSRRIFFTFNPQKKKLDETYDDRKIMTMMKYLRFKYTTWNVSGLGYEDRNYTEYYSKTCLKWNLKG
jgi:hypothetical protein